MCADLDVDPADPSEVERIAVKHMRKGIRLFDKQLNVLTLEGCFKAVASDGSNTIFLIPKAEVNISDQLQCSMSELVSNTASNLEESSKKRGRQ